MASKRPPNIIEFTPSGIEVAFWHSIGVDEKPQQRRYRVSANPEVPAVDGEKFPSVSTIAGVFDKPALLPAGVKLQETGVIELAKRGYNLAAMDQRTLRDAMLDEGLHYDSIWGVARDRGDVAHEMLLKLVRDGEVPDLSDYPEDIRPWIAAGLRWVLDAVPKIMHAEYLVASLEHGFAGRGDLIAELRDGRIAGVDYKTVTEWKVKRNRDGSPTDLLLPPYDESIIASDGYELAAPESGYPATDVRIIVRLGPDGEYDAYEFEPRPEPFLAALDAYRERKYLHTGPPAKAEAVPA